MTFREFTGKNVEEAIRAAMAEFSADLSDLDIEILGQGSLQSSPQGRPDPGRSGTLESRGQVGAGG